MLNHSITEYFILKTPRPYLQADKQITGCRCDFKFTLTSCWNRVIEAENEEEIRY